MPCWLKPVSSKASTGALCAQVDGDLESLLLVMSMKTVPLSFILNSGIPHRIHLKESFWLLKKKNVCLKKKLCVETTILDLALPVSCPLLLPISSSLLFPSQKLP